MSEQRWPVGSLLDGEQVIANCREALQFLADMGYVECWVEQNLVTSEFHVVFDA